MAATSHHTFSRVILPSRISTRAGWGPRKCVAQLEPTDILPAEPARVMSTLVRSYVMTRDFEPARRLAERATLTRLLEDT